MDIDVRNTYNTIANHFSDTRFKVWTCTREFLNNVSPSSNGLEVGCGNGKNMIYRDDINMCGIDICDKFVDMCKKKNLNVIQGDMLKLPYNNEQFDFVMSIAVLHHLDSEEKRIQALNEMFRVCKKDGKIFILVWAFEQEESSKRKFKSKDEMVSWFSREDGNTYYRYYHLYSKDELNEEFQKTRNDFRIIKSFYEMGNWGLIIEKK
jgi:ubiquinone/menaquinone biosynthesis C-methylase UbiE